MKILILGGENFLASTFIKKIAEVAPACEVNALCQTRDVGRLEEITTSLSGTEHEEALSNITISTDLDTPGVAGVFSEEQYDFIAFMEQHDSPLSQIRRLTEVLGWIKTEQEKLIKFLYVPENFNDSESLEALPEFRNDTEYQRRGVEALWAIPERIVDSIGIPYVILRHSSLFGPGQCICGPIPKMLEKFMRSEYYTLHKNGKGEVMRVNPVSARNVSDALVFICQTPDILNEVVHIGGKLIDEKSLALQVSEMVGLRYPQFEMSPNIQEDFIISGNKLSTLGWFPPHTFEEDIQATINYYK